MGVPLGTDDFIDRELRRGLLEPTKEALHDLEWFGKHHPQDAHLLLRACVVPRATYLARMLPPDCPPWQAVRREFDEMVLASARAILALPPWTAEARALAALPTRKGGLGLTSVDAIAPAAYYASTATAMPDALRRAALELQSAATAAAGAPQLGGGPSALAEQAAVGGGADAQQVGLGGAGGEDSEGNGGGGEGEGRAGGGGGGGGRGRAARDGLAARGGHPGSHLGGDRRRPPHPTCHRRPGGRRPGACCLRLVLSPMLRR